MQLSKLITELQNYLHDCGDLKVALAISIPKELKPEETTFQDENIFINLCPSDESQPELILQNFPY
jgi:hypothetical protein